ncbi:MULTISPECIES: hypothetical protein [unclassified Streptomyces]|uniref:hypothetical protein n=1 Tax=unclassified Streptomyces TaxID=2593676 RepID=UPI00382CB2BA
MLGKDQSPGGGHAAAVSAMPCRARQGRSSSTTSFAASLTAYAAAVPMPVSTVPADIRVSPRRTAPHQAHRSSNPRTTRVPSVAASSSGPVQEGASATAPVTERYMDAEAPSVTSTARSVPRPPGASAATAAVPEPRTTQASSGLIVRRGRVLLPVSRFSRFSRISRLMGREPRSGGSGAPGPNGRAHP